MNSRQYKKKFFHKTMKHGGWRKYKKAMKEARGLGIVKSQRKDGRFLIEWTDEFGDT